MKCPFGPTLQYLECNLYVRLVGCRISGCFSCLHIFSAQPLCIRRKGCRDGKEEIKAQVQLCCQFTPSFFLDAFFAVFTMLMHVSELLLLYTGLHVFLFFCLQ